MVETLGPLYARLLKATSSWRNPFPCFWRWSKH